MNLSEFLYRQNLALESAVFSFCQEGIEMMAESLDPFHTEKHIFRILDILDSFLRENDQVLKSQIDFEVLLTAICWHDVWKSRRFPAFWLRGAWQAFWEGLGSRRIFVKEARENGLEKEIVKPVRYAIRKHSTFQITSPKTLEAKILKDVDNLEFWSLERLRDVVHDLEKNNWAPTLLLPTAKIYKYLLRVLNRESSLSFEWSKKERDRRRQNYRVELEKLIAEYEAKVARKPKSD